MPDHSFRTCYCTLKDSKRLLLQQASYNITTKYIQIWSNQAFVFALSFCFVSFLTCNLLSVAKDLQCYLDIPNHQSERPPIDTSPGDAYNTMVAQLTIYTMWLYIRYTNIIIHVINSHPYPLSSFKNISINISFPIIYSSSYHRPPMEKKSTEIFSLSAWRKAMKRSAVPAARWASPFW